MSVFLELSPIPLRIYGKYSSETNVFTCKNTKNLSSSAKSLSFLLPLHKLFKKWD